ncbi:putative exostosin-2 [Fasciola hepatica]|uniref:Exostosin-2 n=1 Tax=Fasciola hepatica TaxID=6192 RepID=A0A4E0RFJ0_FASHE|nr:putative exostosin-2 [Fasciola hepatica]
MRPWIRLGAVCLCLFVIFLFWRCLLHLSGRTVASDDKPSIISGASRVILPSHASTQCTYSTCFDASQCAREHPGRPLNRIGVYVYDVNPLSPVSDQFSALVRAVNSSRYAVHTPTEACVFIPHVDLLNGLRVGLDQALRLTNKSPIWNTGVNHIVFNVIPGKALLFTGQAILAGSVHTPTTYRSTFDVAIPAYNPLLRHKKGSTENRSVLLTILPFKYKPLRSQIYELLSAYRGQPTDSEPNRTVILLRHAFRTDRSVPDRIPPLLAIVSHSSYTREPPKLVDYEDTLTRSTFCAIVHADPLGYLALYDAMSHGCIPVLIDDGMVLPFSEVLDWSRISVRIHRSELDNMPSLLAAYPMLDIRRFQHQVHFIFSRYMSTIEQIALTTLDIVNDRVFPYYARSYAQWNNPDHVENLFPSPPILFYPLRVPSQSQFTILIRGQDHFALLSMLLEQLQSVRGVDRIVVVWTNGNATIPPAAFWPALRVPLSVVPSLGGSVNGRYYPYAQLRTEAILSLDDHSCPPSAKEIELAFELSSCSHMTQLWSHNPDRLIGLASQREWYTNRSRSTTVVSSNLESDGLQVISASFGATFFHKHYLHAYTELLSPTVRGLVDRSELCEDLMLNWLIVQLSGHSVLTTVNVDKNRRVGQKLPHPQIRDMCHLEPYGECWSSLSKLSLIQTSRSAVSFQISPFHADLA